MARQPETIQIVIFCDQGRCYALVQTATPKPPIGYSLDFDDLAGLGQALTSNDLSATARSTIGHALYKRLLPESIAAFLKQTSAEHLVLHLDPALFDLPWEYLFDGEFYLATRFHLGVRLLADDAGMELADSIAHSEVNILQLCHRPSDRLALEQSPDSNHAFTVSRRSTSSMSVADVLQAADTFSVLHYFGPFHQGWALKDGTMELSALFEARGQLALVISEFDNVTGDVLPRVRLATRSNPKIPHIVCAGAVSAQARAVMTHVLYRELHLGQTIGRALTEARLSALTAGLAGWPAYRLQGQPAGRIIKRLDLDERTKSEPKPAAELRQLTVFFCDLVNSTPTSEGLDVEEWDQILKLYNDTASHIVNRHGGVVHQYKGDGLVVYFGYPMAYEDAAVRAVHAALELADEMEHGCAEARALLRAHGRAPLATRVGIHTGPVVVADISGNATATGLTVAFSERIQRVAPGNGVVVSPATQSLVAPYFNLTSLGAQSLKGIATLTECFLVESVRESHNVLLSDSAAKLSPFSGRQPEMEQLRAAWHEAKQGTAQIVLLSGEAGIGKSRLLREFRDTVAGREGLVIGCSCSAYFQNNAFYPVVQGLRRMMQLDSSRSTGTQLDQLAKFAPRDLHGANTLPALANLLGIAMDERSNSLSGTADQQKTAILDALIAWVGAIARQQPILLWAEDVHWIDASTLDYIKRLAMELTSLPLMMVLTFRPESGFTLGDAISSSRSIALAPVSQVSARAMITGTQGSDQLSARVVDQIVGRTDGVPLFIEESMRMVMDILHARSATNSEDLANELDLQIPSTIQGLLTARLDQLGHAKYAAQLGSVIGRTFSLELLEAATDVEPKTLISQLAALMNTGLLKAYLDDSGAVVYSFKHALVRDTAYNSLLTPRRRAMHRNIAAALESRDYRARSEGAELLAHHYAHSEQVSQAIECWMLAAQQAVRSAAQREAIGHLQSTLKAIRQQPPDSHNPKIELRAELMLAACLTAVSGYSAGEAGDAFRRAERLAIEQHDDDALLRARFGLEAYYLMRADFERALSVAHECKRMAEAATALLVGRPAGDRSVRQIIVTSALADWTIGNVLFHKAEFDTAIPYMDRCIERCSAVSDAGRRQVQDPVVMCWIYKAWHAWEAGYPDRAIEFVETGIAIAHRAGHPFGIGVALAFKACILFFRREYTQAIEAADRSIQYSAEPSFRIWWAWARVLRGRSLSNQEHTRDEGIAEIREGLRMWDESDAIVTRPFNLALLAEAYYADGRTVEALELLEIADKTVERHGERYYEPEVRRLQGMMRASVAKDDSENRKAAKFLDDSASIARRRGMRSSELRALCDRVGLYPDDNAFPKAYRRLEQVYTSFNEGLGTADLRAARRLLDHTRVAPPTVKGSLPKRQK